MTDEETWDREWVRVQAEGNGPPWATAAHTAQRLVDVLGLTHGATLLELGCGRGLVAIELAARGLKVTAVDFSAAALELAAAYASERRVEVAWRRDDLRRFVDGRFAAVMVRGGIIAQLTAPGEFEEWMERAADHLAPGGALLLQLYTKEFALLYGVEHRLFHDGESDRFVSRVADDTNMVARLMAADELADIAGRSNLYIERSQYWSRRQDPPGPPQRGVTVVLRAVGK